jgi:hypothetical protein
MSWKVSVAVLPILIQNLIFVLCSIIWTVTMICTVQNIKHDSAWTREKWLTLYR